MARRRTLGFFWAVLTLLVPAIARPAAPATGEPGGPPVSVNPPSDAAIQGRIEGIVDALGGIEGRAVEVRSGVVRLGGHADSLAVRDQAAELARRVEGVVVVRNELQVASDVEGRLRPTWSKVKGHLARALGFLPVLAVALAAFAAFAVAALWVGRLERPFLRIGLSQLGWHIARVAARAVLLVAGLVVALELLGLVAFVGTIVGALGILGVVAGIAFRDVVANYLPGIILGMNPPFGPGDDVQVGEHAGRVVSVLARETILVTYDGQHLRIPNVRLLQETIVNFTRHRERRLHFSLELALSADLRLVRQMGTEALRSAPGLLRDPSPFMRVLTIEADLVEVAFFAWADQQAANFPELESRARQVVKEALLAAGVSFPIREVEVHVPAGDAARSLGREEPDRAEEPILDAHVREEQATPERHDLLREGRTPAT